MNTTLYQVAGYTRLQIRVAARTGRSATAFARGLGGQPKVIGSNSGAKSPTDAVASLTDLARIASGLP